MDFNDTPSEAAFRAEAREWLADNAPPADGSRALDRRVDSERGLEKAKEWQAKKAHAGYARIHFPAEYGGRGLSPIYTVIFDEEEAAYPVPKNYFGIGLGMCAPVMMHYGTEEQKRRYVPPLIRAEEVWCQLFSEPSAGSDLAGLRCRAKRDGDEWVINGQKLWTSGAHYSDWGILVVRHDPTLPKHKGLTFFFVDMKSPGIECRPIKQISGSSDFNEVYFESVRIPDSQRLGEVGEGWQVSITTLMNERVETGGNIKPDALELLDFARTLEIDGRPALENQAIRDRIADWYVDSEGIRLVGARSLTALSRGMTPGAENSISKVVTASKTQEVSSFAMDLLEQAGILSSPQQTWADALFQGGFFYAPGMRIAGGADEILRNIIAERVLSLPGDVRVDRGKPFSDIPMGE
jgi:alkylation response protein AidB-like acyl-CoA dehydrogenase